MLSHINQIDASALFLRLQSAAELLSQEEPILASALKTLFLEPRDMGGLLARLLSRRLACSYTPQCVLENLFKDIYDRSIELSEAATLDVQAVLRRDAASDSATAVVLNQKGFHAIQAYRIAHSLWRSDRRDLALYIQGLSAHAFNVDIHPACTIGHSTMFDHATGIVIGETSVVQNCVSIMQGVTLGGTGKAGGNRHPKIASGVLIGAGAVLLGDISIGKNAKVGAGSVVLADVPACATVVGIPARVVGFASASNPAEEMDQYV